MDTKIPQDLTFKLLASGAAIVTGALVRQGLEAGWSAARGQDPPENPASPLTSWAEALTWAAAVGLAMGLGRVVGRRAFVAAWKRKVGHLPEVLLTR